MNIALILSGGTGTRLGADSLKALEGHDGVLPVLSMKDTVYGSADGRKVSALFDPSGIFAGQAPETFRLGKYLEANRMLLPNRILRINGAAEPAVMAGRFRLIRFRRGR